MMLFWEKSYSPQKVAYVNVLEAIMNERQSTMYDVKTPFQILF